MENAGVDMGENYATMFETVRKCLVCSSPSKRFCSACRNVSYCSRECQKSHWKAHGPLCKFMSHGDVESVRREIEANPTSEVAQHERITCAMHSQGRSFANITAMLNEWFQDAPGFCSRGGFLDCTTSYDGPEPGKHTFLFGRDKEGETAGVLEIQDETLHRVGIGRSRRLRERIVTPAEAHSDVVSYVATSLKAKARAQLGVPLLIFSNFWNIPPGEMTQAVYDQGRRMCLTRRAGSFMIDERGRFEVTQFEPALLKQKEELLGTISHMRVGVEYRW